METVFSEAYAKVFLDEHTQHHKATLQLSQHEGILNGP